MKIAFLVICPGPFQYAGERGRKGESKRESKEGAVGKVSKKKSRAG